ncbi:MAG: metalloregulator ArsR/SmtB family transcription factor [Gammaproteobacteria bacterium]|nr:metalloregulator ArsR/SmtB family transcription factor [Gammaproteobacteria bacterium]NNJ72710.1 winged helix-turn-helix transcriptional regulator [Enterobacterales bacterium]
MAVATSIDDYLPIEQLMANSDDAAVLLKAMSHKSRLMIMCSLYTDELSVGELNKIIPISQSALSQHLAALRQAGLVETRRMSQTIYYSISSDACAAIIHALKEHYCDM